MRYFVRIGPCESWIVAELDEDDCDIQTDYFNHKTTRRVAIGWRKGKRENFATLRKVAATFPETAHLGPGCDVWYVSAKNDEKTAVVDIIATRIWGAPEKGKKTVAESHYEAFVLRPSPSEPGYTVAWVHLGPTKPINEAVDRWRAELTGQAASRTTSSTPPEDILREPIWDKIELSLAGCTTVTVIPDGALCFVPWAALPGRRAGSFLLEDYALATAQSGHQLYACLTAPRGESERMLLVGWCGPRLAAHGTNAIDRSACNHRKNPPSGND